MREPAAQKKRRRVASLANNLTTALEQNLSGHFNDLHARLNMLDSTLKGVRSRVRDFVELAHPLENLRRVMLAGFWIDEKSTGTEVIEAAFDLISTNFHMLLQGEDPKNARNRPPMEYEESQFSLKSCREIGARPKHGREPRPFAHLVQERPPELASAESLSQSLGLKLKKKRISLEHMFSEIMADKFDSVNNSFLNSLDQKGNTSRSYEFFSPNPQTACIKPPARLLDSHARDLGSSASPALRYGSNLPSSSFNPYS